MKVIVILPGWQARLGMIGEFHKQGSAFYFALT